jgi:hypothetical protein
VTTQGRAEKSTDPVRPLSEPGLQERLEGTVVGKIVLSSVIVYLLVALLVTNLPQSELKSTAEPAVEGFLEASALSQTWNLFAPNPRRSTLRLEARMVYEDGTQLVWRQPDGDAVVGEYRAYRWRKWASNMMSDRRQGMWPDLARWVAENHRRDGLLPIEVTLVRQFYFAPPPGSDERDLPGWSDDVLYVARYPEEAR